MSEDKMNKAEEELTMMFGWLYSEACSMADKGFPIQQVELPDLYERARKACADNPVIIGHKVKTEERIREVIDAKQMISETIDEEVVRIGLAEGFSAKVYKDHLDNDTFGHGLTWITETESFLIIKNRSAEALRRITKAFPWLDGDMPLEVAMVLYHMRHWMGLPRLKKWQKTLGYLENKQFAEASIEMLDSAVYRDEATRSRIQALSHRISLLSEETPIEH